MDKKTEEKKEKALQWHPAFYAGIRIELEEEADKLIFENEHQLGTKPKEIDVLIIKKNPNDKITKNIGRIFKGHNIVEYKSPEDYLSVDDFYKVYGYACFYKSDTLHINEIRADDITITYVCHGYPRSLFKHFRKERNFVINECEPGIYYIMGDVMMMQIIITSELSEETNLWLHNLTNNLKENETANKLIREYGKHKDNELYESVMNIIVKANEKRFEEVDKMCDALRKIYEKNLEERMMKERMEERTALILRALKKNDCKTVAEFLGMPLEEVMEIAKAAP